jgi:hypothetical protein
MRPGLRIKGHRQRTGIELKGQRQAGLKNYTPVIFTREAAKV